MKRVVVSSLVSILALSTTSAIAAVKNGSSCTKVSTFQQAPQGLLVCDLVKKKKVWRKTTAVEVKLYKTEQLRIKRAAEQEILSEAKAESDRLAQNAIAEGGKVESAPPVIPAPDDATADLAAVEREAPLRFIGNWKDSAKSVLVIAWKAPAGDVKGYKVEARANLGAWKVVSDVSATTFSAEFAKTSTDGSTSFRVSAVYADGSVRGASPFGIAGQFGFTN